MKKGIALIGIALLAQAGLAAGNALASEKANRLLSEPIPECPDSLYMEYFENGNRTNYEKRLFGRLYLVKRLAAAERKERKGRYTARLAEVIGVVCSMKSWSLPAHDTNCACLKGITPVVELVSSRIAKELMDVVTDPQLALPEETVRTVRAEAERRILAPYLAHIRGELKVGNWGWVKCANNWNAVCHANVVRTALKCYPFGDTNRAEIVRSAVSSMPKFLSGFTDDGYCSEGAGYWNYGFGHFLELADALSSAPEKIELCATEKAKTVAGYGFRYWISPKTSPCFADGGGVPWKGFRDQCAAIWPDLRRDSLALRDTFDVAQVYLCRPASGKGDLAVGFKGGHNGEFHNHNDLGSYNIALGDLIVCGDPGGEVYTRRTFSRDRYVSKVLNSYAHPVPRVAGRLQGTGRRFAAKEVGRAFAPDRDTVTLDLAGGYDCPALKSLTRTFAYDRATDVLKITDRVEFDAPSDFEDPVVTLGAFADATAGGFTIVQGDRRLAVGVRVTGAKADWSEETVENPGRASPRLRTLRLENVTRAEVEFTFRADVPKLIVDTDMYTDIDSGAVALAHVLADRDECELIGVISSTGGGSPAAGMIRLINAAYGRPDLPVSGSVAYVHASDALQLLGGYNKHDALPEFRHGCGDVSQNGQVKADEANVIDDIKIFTRRDARASGGEVA